MQNLFNKLTSETRADFSALLDCIDKTFLLPAKHKRELPQNIAALSRLLTSSRSERRDGYINNPATLQAYMRYFLPWNVYRICKLFSSREMQDFIINLFDDDTNNLIIDLGSGPFTLALAFWISFPTLREKKLTLLNVDHNKLTLAAGRKLFAAFAGDKWEIKTRNCEFHELKKLSGAKLVCAINVYNEVFQKIPEADTEKLSRFADKEARLLTALAAPSAAVLVVEPGVPRSGQFITLLKAALAARLCAAAYPCPASAAGAANIPCSMRGGKRGAKWCHFSFESGDAPLSLRELSQHAGLAKEKAVLSFLLASQNLKRAIPDGAATDMTLRVISDMFTLEDGDRRDDGGRGDSRGGDRGASRGGDSRSRRCCYGRYACSPRGLILISGEKEKIAAYTSGALLKIDKPEFKGTDKKSGAKILVV